MATSNIIATILSPPSIGAMSGATGVYDYYRVGHNSSVTNVDAVWTFKTPTGGTITDIAWTFTWNNTAAGTGWEGDFTYAFTLSESSEAGTLVNGLKTVTANCAGSSGSVTINFTDLKLLPNKRYYLRANYTNATSKSTMKAAASNQNLAVTYVVPVLERSIITGYDNQADKYTIYAEVSNAINVYAPTWTEKDGQDEVASEDLWLELKHYSDMGESGPWTVNGETYTYGREVKREKHKNEYGTYISQLYANHGTGADIDLNKTLYAYYTQDLIFKDSHEEETQLLPPQKINWGDELGELPIPKKVGFDFIGWTIGKENSGGGITWDGDYKGLAVGDHDGMRFYKISDDVPTMEEALKGGYYKLSDSNVKHPITSDMVTPYMNGDPRLYNIDDLTPTDNIFISNGMSCMVVLEDNIVQDMANGLYWDSPEKGIYTVAPPYTNGVYLTELFLNGIHHQLQEVTYVESTTKYYPTMEVIVEPEDDEDSGSVESDDLLWNGVTTGLYSVELNGSTFYQISTKAPSIEQARAGGYVEYAYIEEKKYFTSDDINIGESEHLYIIMMPNPYDHLDQLPCIVATQTVTLEGLTLKKGVYVQHSGYPNYHFVSLLHIEGYSFKAPSGSDTLTWDGEIEGLTSATLDDIPIYKISSGAPSMTEAQNGGVFTTTAITTETAFTSSDVRQYSDDGLVYVMTLGSRAQLMVVTTDNCEVIFDGEVITTIAEKGIYVPSPDIIPEYVTKIQINDYYGFEESSSSGGGSVGVGSGGSSVVVFDGNTEGKLTVEFTEANVIFVKVSDAAPTLADVANGGTVHVITPEVEQEAEYSSSDSQDMGNGAFAFAQELAFSVPYDNYNVEGMVTFPESGTWFVVQEGTYASYVTINGYNGFGNGEGALTWDGNTAGLTSADAMGMTVYKISSAAPTLAEAQKGGSFTTSVYLTEKPFPGEAAQLFSDDGLVYAIIVGDNCASIVATTDNCEWLFDGEIAGVFPEKGIYAADPANVGEYVTKLRINGYFGFGSVGSSVVENIDTLTWDGNTAGLGFVSAMGDAVYKLSSNAPTLAELQEGGFFTSSTITTETPFTSDAVMPISENGLILGLILADGAVQLYVVLQDNTDLIFDGEVVVTFPGKGIYTVPPEITGDYVTMLKINNYTGFVGSSDSGSQIKIIRTGWDLLGTSGTLYAQWKRGGIRRRYIDGEWRKATRHRFIDGEWKQAIPYRYSDGKWRIGT